MSTWILLRGLTRESRHWGGFPSLLREAIRADRVITPDLPGNGSLCEQVTPTRVADLAGTCRAELLGTGVVPPFFLLGMSLGAMVATDWAVGHPEEVRGCVLINTSMRPFSPFHRRLRPANSGHDLPLDDAPWIAQRVAAWLTAGRSGAADATEWISTPRAPPSSRAPAGAGSPDGARDRAS